MIQNQVVLKVKKEERVYTLNLSPESPLGEVFDVLTEMRQEILRRIQHASQDPQNKTEEQPEVACINE